MKSFRLRTLLRGLILSGLFVSFRGQAVEIPLTTAEGFAVPQAGRVFTFPHDHGSHPEFKIEWWYVTGHLFTADRSRRFGYEATFFRSAAPDKTTQFHLAHMALTDVKNDRFYHQERLNREGWDASSAIGTLAIRNGPWSLRFAPDAPNAPADERLILSGGVRGEVGFTFTLTPLKSLVIFGENGLSRKGAAPTAASHYLTFPRLRTEGTLTVGEQRLAVTGESWMDHEISSSQLDANQVGWDWAGIQLNDGREIMFYRMRLRDGSSDPASSLTWVDQAGTLRKSDFKWEVVQRWTSPASGAVYPIGVRITTTDPANGKRVALTLVPLIKDQELGGKSDGISYWEGACRVLDAEDREIGSAYLELTGYAKELKI